MFFNLLQLTGGVLLSGAYVPQITQIIRTKSVEDLNFKTFLFVFIGILFMEVYAVNLYANGSGLMFLITNTMSLILSGMMAGLIFKYKED